MLRRPAQRNNGKKILKQTFSVSQWSRRQFALISTECQTLWVPPTGWTPVLITSADRVWSISLYSAAELRTHYLIIWTKTGSASHVVKIQIDALYFESATTVACRFLRGTFMIYLNISYISLFAAVMLGLLQKHISACLLVNMLLRGRSALWREEVFILCTSQVIKPKGTNLCQWKGDNKKYLR